MNEQCSVKQFILTQLVLGFIKKKLKTLILTENTVTLDIIEAQMQDLNICYSRIDGSVYKTEDRDRICKNFNTGENVSVLLMTIKVGGIGLNLQAAQRVIIFSPQWNPAVEEQAVGRAYRIG